MDKPWKTFSEMLGISEMDRERLFRGSWEAPEEKPPKKRLIVIAESYQYFRHYCDQRGINPREASYINPLHYRFQLAGVSPDDHELVELASTNDFRLLEHIRRFQEREGKSQNG